MKLSDISIRRPVLASMLSLALILFGVIGYTRLAVREFPDVDPPIVSVSTELPGANPQVVEAMARAQSTLNVHSRYLHEGIIEFAERLTKLHAWDRLPSSSRTGRLPSRKRSYD